jgi:hypothetical protein
MKKSNFDFLSEGIIALIGFTFGIVVAIFVYDTHNGTKIAYEDKYGNVQVIKVCSYIEDTSNNTITFEDSDNKVYNNIDNYVIIK